MQAGEIAREQGISLKYLESILATLKASRLIISERGKRGGYALARPPEEISLHDVLTPLENTMEFVHCTEAGVEECERADICVTRGVWTELKVAIDGILLRTTLRDLVERREKLAASGMPCEGVIASE